MLRFSDNSSVSASTLSSKSSNRSQVDSAYSDGNKSQKSSSSSSTLISTLKSPFKSKKGNRNNQIPHSNSNSSNISFNSIPMDNNINNGIDYNTKLPPRKIIKALEYYNSRNSKELSFKEGDFFFVTKEIENYYIVYNPLEKVAGMVPKDYFSEVENKRSAINRSLSKSEPKTTTNQIENSFVDTSIPNHEKDRIKNSRSRRPPPRIVKPINTTDVHLSHHNTRHSPREEHSNNTSPYNYSSYASPPQHSSPLQHSTQYTATPHSPYSPSHSPYSPNSNSNNYNITSPYSPRSNPIQFSSPRSNPIQFSSPRSNPIQFSSPRSNPIQYNEFIQPSSSYSSRTNYEENKKKTNNNNNKYNNNYNNNNNDNYDKDYNKNYNNYRKNTNENYEIRNNVNENKEMLRNHINENINQDVTGKKFGSYNSEEESGYDTELEEQIKSLNIKTAELENLNTSFNGNNNNNNNNNHNNNNNKYLSSSIDSSSDIVDDYYAVISEKLEKKIVALSERVITAIIRSHKKITLDDGSDDIEYQVEIFKGDGQCYILYRNYSDFKELVCSLIEEFPEKSGLMEGHCRVIPYLLPKNFINESILDNFLQYLVQQSQEIQASDKFVKFFEVRTGSEEKDYAKEDSRNCFSFFFDTKDEDMYTSNSLFFGSGAAATSSSEKEKIRIKLVFEREIYYINVEPNCSYDTLKSKAENCLMCSGIDEKVEKLSYLNEINDEVKLYGDEDTKMLLKLSFPKLILYINNN